jgi:hypothetical protein
MRPMLLLCALAAAALAACADGGSPTTARYLNALTGQGCELDRASYLSRTVASAAAPLDCLGHHAHASGEPQPEPGPDEPCCQFPQPGCDRNACCEPELVEPEGPPIK